MNPLQPIGRAVLALLAEIGRVSLFLKDAVVQGLTPTYYVRQIFEQMWRIGYNSLPVVGLTSFFTGGALALQIYQGSTPGTASTLVPNIVALGITRELGPVLAGLMVSGRVGASIAAELGTMRVTEQIDALESLAVDSFKYLVVTRVLACVIALPLLTVLMNFAGMVGGFFAETIISQMSFSFYFKSAFSTLSFSDYIPPTLKTMAFGFVIGCTSSYLGYQATGGAEGVGRASTQSVVLSSVFLIVLNVVLVKFIFFLYPGSAT